MARARQARLHRGDGRPVGVQVVDQEGRASQQAAQRDGCQDASQAPQRGGKRVVGNHEQPHHERCCQRDQVLADHGLHPHAQPGEEPGCQRGADRHGA